MARIVYRIANLYMWKDEGRFSQALQVYSWFFLELCTDFAELYTCETGRKATKVGVRLQSLSYAKLNQRKQIKTLAYIALDS